MIVRHVPHDTWNPYEGNNCTARWLTTSLMLGGSKLLCPFACTCDQCAKRGTQGYIGHNGKHTSSECVRSRRCECGLYAKKKDKNSQLTPVGLMKGPSTQRCFGYGQRPPLTECIMYQSINRPHTSVSGYAACLPVLLATTHRLVRCPHLSWPGSDQRRPPAFSPQVEWRVLAPALQSVPNTHSHSVACAMCIE
jgi:hypothetical protein